MVDNDMRKPNHADRMAALAREIADGSPECLSAIDSALQEIKQEWFDVIGLREIAARRHGMMSPAPVSIIDTPLHVDTDVYRKNARQAPPTEPIKDLKLVAGSGADFLWKIIEARRFGIPHHELGEEFDKTPQGAKSKGGRGQYYQALQRLKGTGHVQMWKSRFWAIHHLRNFRADVEAGRMQDIEDQPRFKSKWTSEVLDYLRKRGDWIGTRDVADHMKTLPAYADRENLLNQASAVLRTLKLRGAVERKGDSVKGSFWRAVKDYKSSNGPVAETERATEEVSPSAARH